MIVDTPQLLGPQAQFGPMAIIGVVAKRHERVEPIVAAGKFQHHQNTVAHRAVIRQRHRTRQPNRHGHGARGPEAQAVETGLDETPPIDLAVMQ